MFFNIVLVPTNPARQARAGQSCARMVKPTLSRGCDLHLSTGQNRCLSWRFSRPMFRALSEAAQRRFLRTFAALAQLVRALDCGSRGPPFDPGRRYHPLIKDFSNYLQRRGSACCYARLQGRHRGVTGSLSIDTWLSIGLDQSMSFRADQCFAPESRPAKPAA